MILCFKMSNEKLLLTGKMSKVAWHFAIPSIISMVVWSLYNIVDRIFVGNIPEAGSLAMTGMGLTQPIMTLVFALVMVVSVGTGTQVSIQLGARKKKLANAILANSLKLMVGFCGLATILVTIFGKKWLGWLGADETVLPFAWEYLRWISLGWVVQGVGFVLVTALRSAGHPHMSTITNVAGTVVNIILDAWFIFGLGWGVAGAAIATVISVAVSLGIVVWFFWKHRAELPIRIVRPSWDIDLKLTIMTAKIGVAPGAMQGANSLVILMLNGVLLKYGGNVAVAALTIMQSIQNLAFLPVIGYCQGQQPIIGFNYGAKKYSRVRENMKYSFKMCLLFGVGAWLLGILAAAPLVRLFGSDAELIRVATFGVRATMVMAVVVSGMFLLTNYFQYIGKAKQALFLSFLRQMTVLLPLIYILPQFWGLNGVWVAWPVSDVIAAMIVVVVFWREWKRLPREDGRVGERKLRKLKREIGKEKGPELEGAEELLGV